MTYLLSIVYNRFNLIWIKLIFFICAISYSSFAFASFTDATIEDYCVMQFDKGDDSCRAKIYARLLNKANLFVVVFMYKFDDYLLAKQLANMSELMPVIVFVDERAGTKANNPAIAVLESAKVLTVIKNKNSDKASFHHKIIIVGEAITGQPLTINIHLATGSYNLTKDASQNQYNDMVFIKSLTLGKTLLQLIGGQLKSIAVSELILKYMETNYSFVCNPAQEQLAMQLAQYTPALMPYAANIYCSKLPVKKINLNK